jgi:hypothetical protein
MPHTNGQAITTTLMDNILRGLYRDNTTRSTVGTGEDDLGSVTITGNTIGATGSVEVLAVGTITGAAGTKRIKIYFGATAIVDTLASAGTSDWLLRARISNTATGAQRCLAEFSDHTNATNYTKDYITAAIDTTASVILKVTGECANGADLVTETMLEIDIVQRT